MIIPDKRSPHSQHSPCLAGAVVRLESGANDNGSTAYLPGLAAAAARVSANLSDAHHSSPARCVEMRLQPFVLTPHPAPFLVATAAHAATPRGHRYTCRHSTLSPRPGISLE